MVFLAITPTGLSEALRIATAQGLSVWCGADAISEAEYQSLGAPNLSRFIYSLADASTEKVASAVDTIEQHHPGESVWIENLSASRLR